MRRLDRHLQDLGGLGYHHFKESLTGSKFGYRLTVQPAAHIVCLRIENRIVEEKLSNKLRQKLLVLYAHSPDLNSKVVAWSLFDGTRDEQPSTASEDESPYTSIVAAMRDGWRVIQFPQQFPAYPGMEYTTSFLKFEYILEKLEESDV
jgi:hypothetical protein